MCPEITPIPVPMFVAAAGGPDDEAPDRDQSALSPIGAQPRVLIVEDEGLVAINMESALAEAGFHVVAVVDTENDAVLAAQRLKPDVILMDITLREGNGISAAKTIQAASQVCVIFVSGNSDPNTLIAIGQMPASGFIRKPFLTERFAGLVRGAMTKKN